MEESEERKLLREALVKLQNPLERPDFAINLIKRIEALLYPTHNNDPLTSGDMLASGGEKVDGAKIAKPELSAEQEVINLLEKNRREATGVSDAEKYSNTARHNSEAERHREVESLCIKMAQRLDAMVLRSLTARDEGIESVLNDVGLNLSERQRSRILSRRHV